ncbi:MAG: PepSY-associated TM helix domain-containing protein [Gammaproteobacteria bacterium]
MVEVDPYTEEVIKSRFWGKTLTSWIYNLHSTLLMGETGYEVLGIIGLLFMGSLITGVYLWWPRGGKWRQTFTLKRGASPERWVFDIHKLCGISSVSVLFILAFTGVYFHYGDYLHPLLNWLSPIREKPPFEAPEGLTSKVIPGAATLSITRAIAIGRQRFPNSELKGIKTPEGPARVYELRMRQPGEVNVGFPSSTVWIDQYSGEMLHARDPNRFTAGETFLNLMWPLHDGEALRLPGRILVCLTGFVPLVPYVTGIMRWLQKRRAAKQLKARFEEKISRDLQDA